MSFRIGLLIVLTVQMVAAIPTWPYSNGWGLRPSCALAFMIAVVIFFLETGDR